MHDIVGLAYETTITNCRMEVASKGCFVQEHTLSNENILRHWNIVVLRN